MLQGLAAQNGTIRKTARDLRQTEVSHLGMTLRVEQDITGFQVAVDNVIFVQQRQSCSNFGHDDERSFNRRSVFSFFLKDVPLQQTPPGAVFHYQHQVFIHLLEVVDLHQVVVLQARPQLGFNGKTLAPRRVNGAAHTRRVMAQNLQGARHAQLEVLRQVDFAKRPLPQQAFDFIRIQYGITNI